MQFRRFGKTELQTSVFTFGGMRIPPLSEEEAVAVVHRGVELGINHLETARGYGKSEVLFGAALRGLKREELIITTKIPPADTADEMRRNIDESLERMGIDHIDNFDIHGINNADLLEKTLRPGGCLTAVRKAMDEGLIGHLGFSTHGPLEVILEAINTREFESVNLHYYLFFQRNEPAVQRAHELDMGVFIISPSDKGGMLFNPPPLLSRLAQPRTPLTLNHRFLLSDPRISTLSLGAGDPAHYDDHLVVADEVGPLTDEEEAAIDRVMATMQSNVGEDYCTVCFQCLPCPEEILIPEVLRLRNLTVGLDMEEYGRYRYKMFGNAGHWFPGKQGDKCTECGDCLPRCPVKLNIPQLLLDTHARLSGEKGKRLWAEE